MSGAAAAAATSLQAGGAAGLRGGEAGWREGEVCWLTLAGVDAVDPAVGEGVVNPAGECTGVVSDVSGLGVSLTGSLLCFATRTGGATLTGAAAAEPVCNVIQDKKKMRTGGFAVSTSGELAQNLIIEIWCVRPKRKTSQTTRSFADFQAQLEKERHYTYNSCLRLHGKARLCVTHTRNPERAKVTQTFAGFENH